MYLGRKIKINQCVIVIPIHNPHPTENELLSFAQCFKILNSYPITVIAPDNLNVGKYRTAVADFSILYIDPVWQSNLAQYNKLKVHAFFYKLFRKYEYLLTYELDAWVFKDELTSWCDKKFDYIGAPWFINYGSSTKGDSIVGVGNSGFSLRNIRSSLRILKRIAFVKKWRKFWFRFRLQSIIRFEKVILIFGRYLKIKSVRDLPLVIFNPYEMHEDRYWSEIIASVFSDYKVASIEEAIKFSFEENPSFLFNLNDNQLPFGCHAWEKYEPEFWNKFIN